MAIRAATGNIIKLYSCEGIAPNPSNNNTATAAINWWLEEKIINKWHLTCFNDVVFQCIRRIRFSTRLRALSIDRELSHPRRQRNGDERQSHRNSSPLTVCVCVCCWEVEIVRPLFWFLFLSFYFFSSFFLCFVAVSQFLTFISSRLWFFCSSTLFSVIFMFWCSLWSRSAARLLVRRRYFQNVCDDECSNVSNVRRRPLQWRHSTAKGHFRVCAPRWESVEVCSAFAGSRAECCDQSGMKEKRIQMVENGSQMEPFFFDFFFSSLGTDHCCSRVRRTAIRMWGFDGLWAFVHRMFWVYNIFFCLSSFYNRSSAANRLKCEEEKKYYSITNTVAKGNYNIELSFTSFVFEITCVWGFVCVLRGSGPIQWVFDFVVVVR